jgi:hypothetical protein
MAITWESSIQGFLRKEDWLNVGFDVTRQTDPIDGIFGDERTDNITAKWQSIAAGYQLPMMAQFHAFDTESQQTVRVPVDTHNVEKGLIKVKINQSERLRTLARSGVQGDQALYDYVFADGLNLADQVITRTKVAKNEALATGKLTINENDLSLEVDYGVPSDNKGHSIVFGSTSDVPAQIQAIVDAALLNGVTLDTIVTSRKIINKMRASRSIQIVINGTNAAGATVSRQALEAWLSSEYGINRVITNDLTYNAGQGIGSDGKPVLTVRRYYPDDKITFMATNPAGRVGVGLWGNPPEVDLTGYGATVNTTSRSPFVYVSQYMEKDPAVLWTKASGLFIPVIYNPTHIHIATCTETGA